MERLAAIFGDTRDSEGRQRFIQHLPENLYKPSGGSVNTIRKHDFYPVSTVKKVEVVRVKFKIKN